MIDRVEDKPFSIMFFLLNISSSGTHDVEKGGCSPKRCTAWVEFGSSSWHGVFHGWTGEGPHPGGLSSQGAPLTPTCPSLPQEKDLRDVGDWRKNIEEKSGMEGRKKMFEAGES